MAFSGLQIWAQIDFKKGYYINNSNERIECLIKNVDWLNNPVKFESKLNEGAQSTVITIGNVKEFGIYNSSKYIRSEVNIDKSSSNLRELDYDRNLSFVKETLFLKVLIEGKANLYSYVNSNLKRFFFKTEDGGIQQLVYKKYRLSSNEISTNNGFRQQLWTNLKCGNISTTRIERMDYEKNQLLQFFKNYNQCNNAKFVNYQQDKDKKDLFNLSVRVGVNNTSFDVVNFSSTALFQNGSQMNMRFGLEAEFILPFNSNKWSIIFEPNYQSFQTDPIFGSASSTLLDFSYVELPIGIRHYAFLNDSSKLFFNASGIYNISTSDLYDISRETQLSYGFGVGYKYLDRYSVELRYHTYREIAANNANRGANYGAFSVILGYTLF